MKTASLLQIRPSQGVTRPVYHEPLAAPTTQGEISEQSTRAARSTAVTVTETVTVTDPRTTVTGGRCTITLPDHRSRSRSTRR